MIALQLGGATMLVFAAVAFARRGRRERDEFLQWLAAGAVLGAFARVDYVLVHESFVGWVYIGDVLRLGFYVLILIGAVREIRRYQRRAAEAAALSERHRVARDLHDGLAQELAYIAVAARSLQTHGPGGVDLDDLVLAAERALVESREAIHALAGDSDETLAETIGAAARDIARRERAEVELDLAEDVEVSADVRAALRKIVREAAANAVRHGRASRIAIELRQEEGVSLKIRDNGKGITASANGNGGGYGLQSMRQRAEILGGSFCVMSDPDSGTEIVVTLP
jgi:signal transduction histidine kinase